MRSGSTRAASGCTSTRSFDEAPPREMEEHVLERAAAHEDTLRCEPALVEDGGRCVAGGRVREHPVRERLDPLDEPVGPVADVLRTAAVVEAQLDDVTRRV